MVGVLAFLLTLAWKTQHETSLQLLGRRAELATIVEARQRHTQDLERTLDALRARVDATAVQGGTRLRGLQQLIASLARTSGTTGAVGPGLLVELADASAGENVHETDGRIQDVDIQAVVNALWDAGAEAIGVNGQRLVSTSAIRNAGRAVLVNYSVLHSPYRIAAIGDPGAMQNRFQDSAITHRFQTWVDVYGLGFAVSVEKEITLPPFTGSLRFRHAEPVESS